MCFSNFVCASSVHFHWVFALLLLAAYSLSLSLGYYGNSVWQAQELWHINFIFIWFIQPFFFLHNIVAILYHPFYIFLSYLSFSALTQSVRKRSAYYIMKSGRVDCILLDAGVFMSMIFSKQSFPLTHTQLRSLLLLFLRLQISSSALWLQKLRCERRASKWHTVYFHKNPSRMWDSSF